MNQNWAGHPTLKFQIVKLRDNVNNIHDSGTHAEFTLRFDSLSSYWNQTLFGPLGRQIAGGDGGTVHQGREPLELAWDACTLVDDKDILWCPLEEAGTNEPNRENQATESSGAGGAGGGRGNKRKNGEGKAPEKRRLRPRGQ